MRIRRSQCATGLLSLAILGGVGSFLYGGNDASLGEAAAIPGATRAEESQGTGRTEVVRERYNTQAVKLERSITQDSNLNFVNHGPWTMWDPAGNLVARGEYRMGKRHGVWRRWHIGGAGVKSGDPAQKSVEEDAFNGPEFEGFTRPFLSEAKFDNDKLAGTWTIADSEGKQIASVDLDHDVLNGKVIAWFANGAKHREITLRQGVLDGYWKEWDAEKNLVRNDHYIEGSRLAEAALTFDSGEKSSEGVYLYAKDTIKADLDWWNGRISIQATPGEGKQAKQGKWTYWFQTGEKRCDAEYLDDKPVNTHVWWYRTGQKECEGRYLEGQPHGVWTYWHENGLQAANGEYNKGARIGRWMRWSAEGKVVENVDHGMGAGATVAMPGRHFYTPAHGKATIVPPPPSAPIAGANPPPATTPAPAPRTARTYVPANNRR